MDFAQQPMENMQPGQSGTAAKPSPEQIMRQIALARQLQGVIPRQSQLIPPITQ